MPKPTTEKSQRLVSAYTTLTQRFGLSSAGRDARKRARLMYFLSLADAGSRLPLPELLDTVADQFTAWLDEQGAH
jgi:hypothetical protein